VLHPSQFRTSWWLARYGSSLLALNPPVLPLISSCLLLSQGVSQAAVQSGPSCTLSAPGQDQAQGWQPTGAHTAGRRQLQQQPQAQAAQPTSQRWKTAANRWQQQQQLQQQAQAGGGYACSSSSRAAARGCLQGLPSFGAGCKI
jgi:hypothetical protein